MIEMLNESFHAVEFHIKEPYNKPLHSKILLASLLKFR